MHFQFEKLLTVCNGDLFTPVFTRNMYACPGPQKTSTVHSSKASGVVYTSGRTFKTDSQYNHLEAKREV